MAIKSKDELLSSISEILGERNDDASLAFMEDLADTLQNSDSENWQQRYRENDAAWRVRYKQRFLSGTESGFEPRDEPEAVKPKIYSFDELFKGV